MHEDDVETRGNEGKKNGSDRTRKRRNETQRRLETVEEHNRNQDIVG